MKSIFKEKIEETSQKKIVDYTKLDNLPEVIPKTILGNIVEKKYSDEDIKKFKYNVPYYKTGFPPIIPIQDKEILTKKVCYI